MKALGALWRTLLALPLIALLVAGAVLATAGFSLALQGSHEKIGTAAKPPQRDACFEEFKRPRSDTADGKLRPTRVVSLAVESQSVDVTLRVRMRADGQCAQQAIVDQSGFAKGSGTRLFEGIAINDRPIGADRWSSHRTMVVAGLPVVERAYTARMPHDGNLWLRFGDLTGAHDSIVADSIVIRGRYLNVLSIFPPPVSQSDTLIVLTVPDDSSWQRSAWSHASVSLSTSDSGTYRESPSTRQLMAGLSGRLGAFVYSLATMLVTLLPLLLYLGPRWDNDSDVDAMDRVTWTLLRFGVVVGVLGLLIVMQYAPVIVRRTFTGFDDALGKWISLPRRPFLLDGIAAAVIAWALGVAPSLIPGHALAGAPSRIRSLLWRLLIAVAPLMLLGMFALTFRTGGWTVDSAGWLSGAVGLIVFWVIVELTNLTLLASRASTVGIMITVIALFVTSLLQGLSNSPVLLQRFSMRQGLRIAIWMPMIVFVFIRVVVPPVRLFFTVMEQDVSRRLARRLSWMALLAIVLASFPLGPFVGTDNSPESWFHIGNAAVGVRYALPLTLIAWILIIILGLKRAPNADAAALLALAAAIFPASPEVLYLPLTFLLGRLLLSLIVQPADPEERQRREAVSSKRGELVRLLSAIRTAESANRAARQKDIAKLMSAEVVYADYANNEAARREALSKLREGPTANDGVLLEYALNYGPRATQWDNAMHGLRWSLILGAPWIVTSITGTLNEPGDSLHPLWTLAFGTVLATLRWAALGFAFGFFYPRIRGRSGLGKGLWLFLAAALPLLPAGVLSVAGSAAWQPIVLVLLQLFVHCVLLGLVAFDAAFLRESGDRNWRGLFELHGVPALGVSVSSVIVAVGATLATLTTGSATTIVNSAIAFLFPALSRTPGAGP